MSEPVIFDKKPVVMELEKGTYYWCSCGRSETQPFCDGAHKKTGEFQPVTFKIDEKQKVPLCNCKKTATPPYCDGAHKDL